MGESYQKNIISLPALEMPPIKGIGSTFFEKMLEHKAELAQIDAISGQKQTYGELLKKCIRTAIKMRDEGLRSNDIISICTFNHLDSCVPLLAGLFLDVKTAPLDPTISLADTIQLLKQIGPKMVFVGPEAIELIEKVLKETKTEATIVVFGETTKHLKFSDFLRPSPEEESFAPVDVKDVKATALILFSSGTTGLPKGICLNHYALLGSFYQNGDFIRRGEIGLSFASMYWISYHTTLLYCIMTGATRLVHPKFHPVDVWNLITKFKVNVMGLAPLQLIYMCKDGRPEGVDVSSLKFVKTVGGPLSLEQTMKIRECLDGALLCRSYGQTELSGGGIIFNFLCEPEHRTFLLEKPNSCGMGRPGNCYKVVDPDTEKVLGPYQEGELRIKSEIQMNGYYNMDSSDRWDSEGYLKTGDIAYYDDDLCFYIVDRVREMLKFRSYQVPPAKLENILLTHPAIENAVVIGLPHPEDGDHPMGIVILKEKDVGNTSTEEIEKFVEEKVDDRQKLRGGVKFVKNFPITPTGKINRRYLRTLVSQGLTW